jgi:hypothetical protein
MVAGTGIARNYFNPSDFFPRLSAVRNANSVGALPAPLTRHIGGRGKILNNVTAEAYGTVLA